MFNLSEFPLFTLMG